MKCYKAKCLFWTACLPFNWVCHTKGESRDSMQNSVIFIMADKCVTKKSPKAYKGRINVNGEGFSWLRKELKRMGIRFPKSSVACMKCISSTKRHLEANPG